MMAFPLTMVSFSPQSIIAAPLLTEEAHLWKWIKLKVVCEQNYFFFVIYSQISVKFQFSCIPLKL